MQKDDLEIDLHALTMKLEQALPNYKTLQFQVEELSVALESAQQVALHSQQELEIVRRQSVQTKQQIELLEKRHGLFESTNSANYWTDGAGKEICRSSTVRIACA